MKVCNYFNNFSEVLMLKHCFKLDDFIFMFSNLLGNRFAYKKMEIYYFFKFPASNLHMIEIEIDHYISLNRWNKKYSHWVVRI